MDHLSFKNKKSHMQYNHMTKDCNFARRVGVEVVDWTSDRNILQDLVLRVLSPRVALLMATSSVAPVIVSG